MPFRNLIVLTVSMVLAVVAYAARDRSTYGRSLGEVIAAVERTYIEPVDRDGLFESAVAGVMDKLDENSRYIDRNERADFEASLDLEFCGVGMELAGGDSATDGRNHGEFIRIEGLMPDSPAWRAGLSTGDSILAIDGGSTRGMTTAQAVAKLRGPPGSRVTVTVAGAGADASTTVVRDVPLVRESIRIESVLGDRRRKDGGWDWRLEGRPEIAFVRITSFGELTRDDLEKAIASTLAEGRPAGLVLDLRGNPGGLVSAAVEVADLFLDSREPIVATRSRRSAPNDSASNAGQDRIDRRLASDGDILEGMPMAVLVDEETASAAEIVAAAVQDHRRGRVFGSRTFGKGTVQQIVPLTFDDGLLKITTSEYLRPSGKEIQRSDSPDATSWGVSPDPGSEVSISRESARRLAEWRRGRDVVRPRNDQPSGEPSPGDPAAGRSIADLPEQVDPAVGRAVAWLTAPPAPPTPGKNSPPRR